MKLTINVAIVFLLLTPAFANAQSHGSKDEKTKEEIQKLFGDLNEAITKKDRARLEQLYADEFQFVRPSGAVIDKTKQISGIMANDPLLATPVPAPAHDSLMLYGDVAVARHSVRGTAVSSIFVKKNGQWQLLQAQGTRLAPERNPINLDPKLLDSFVGKYQFGPNAVATVTREGDALKWRGGNRMPVTLVPLSETRFFAKETETEMMFVKNEKGQVTDVVLRVGSCQDSKATKM
ncbi:MAG TPA: DUF4440 domain-containing protein [Pyrinomonadaceae bacterium]|nr:DUF4440 domain-containing protein [Pyrinomonadaceae bacterium]